MKPTDSRVVPLEPQAPKVQEDLVAWRGVLKPTMEIRDSVLTDKDLSGVKRLFLEGSTLQSVSWSGAMFDKLEITDSRLSHGEAAGIRAYEANFLRVVITNCRFTGADFAEGQFEDCMFKNVKFDETGFRFMTFKRVRFENCILRQADFSSAKLSDVSFNSCELDNANFAQAACKRVALGDENLMNIKGVLGLKGSSVSDEQLIQIAPLLAVELGFQVHNQN